jgi:predicted N-acetyltransferase YhbS
MRPLVRQDLDTVVAIDAALGGRTRRAYFERRLAAAQRDPERNLQLGLERRGTLAGYMLGRVLEGEFGRSEARLRLEALGVHPAARGQGLGSTLHQGLEKEASRRGLGAIHTSGSWREHALLRFLDRRGYRLAESHVLDCAPRADFEPLARDALEVRTLGKADMEGIARIDRRHTGRERRGYLCRTLEETLADSAIRVSLAAHVDGAIAGFVMARVDYGDFGRAEPVAVIDALGVDPMRARQGIGRALVSQLFVNLAALAVERVETVVAPGSLSLMGFFWAAGMRPAERLNFVKQPLGA